MLRAVDDENVGERDGNTEKSRDFLERSTAKTMHLERDAGALRKLGHCLRNTSDLVPKKGDCLRCWGFVRAGLGHLREVIAQDQPIFTGHSSTLIHREIPNDSVEISPRVFEKTPFRGRIEAKPSLLDDILGLRAAADNAVRVVNQSAPVRDEKA